MSTNIRTVDNAVWTVTETQSAIIARLADPNPAGFIVATARAEPQYSLWIAADKVIAVWPADVAPSP